MTRPSDGPAPEPAVYGQWLADIKTMVRDARVGATLLFFNYLLNRFVVIDLKVEHFKPEFARKMNF